jgi:hypothetical protein
MNPLHNKAITKALGTQQSCTNFCGVNVPYEVTREVSWNPGQLDGLDGFRLFRDIRLR